MLFRFRERTCMNHEHLILFRQGEHHLQPSVPEKGPLVIVSTGDGVRSWPPPLPPRVRATLADPDYIGGLPPTRRRGRRIFPSPAGPVMAVSPVPAVLLRVQSSAFPLCVLGNLSTRFHPCPIAAPSVANPLPCLSHSVSCLPASDSCLPPSSPPKM